MSKPSLFLCRSPLQLLNCIEACEHFGLRDTHTIMVCAWRVERDKQMMQRLLDMYPHWSELYFFRLYPIKRQMSVMLKVFGRNRHFANLFYGDSTHLINFFINKIGHFDSIYMVDDGLATLRRAQMIAERQIHLYRKNFQKRGEFASWLMAELGLSTTFYYQAKIFTTYDMSHPHWEGRVIHNTMAFTKSCIGDKPRSNEIWFIGSDIRPELLLNSDDCNDFFDQVHRHIDLSRVVYIPHRKEPDEYMIWLNKRYGMEIRRLKDIIEIEMINAPSIPSTFISFVSSAVDTIDMLVHPETKVFCIPEDAIAPLRRKSIRGAYQNYADKGFELIDLQVVKH